MQTKSNIQLQIEEIERRAKLGRSFESFVKQYESVEGVFNENIQEITKGYLMEEKEFDNIIEACNNFECGKLLHITESGKYIIGSLKTISEATGKIFDIALLKYVE